MEPNLGITGADRKKIADGLAHVLADTYTLYLKTHNYHWNVTGPHFSTLHALFETQYQDLAAAVDLIAERIRALGEYAPGSYKVFAQYTSIEEANGTPRAEEMVKNLAQDHETLTRAARKLLPEVQDAKDEASADLLIERMTVHEKTAWMLRASL